MIAAQQRSLPWSTGTACPRRSSRARPCSSTHPTTTTRTRRTASGRQDACGRRPPHLRLGADGKLARVGGVDFTIKDGIVYDARALRADVLRMVAEDKSVRGINILPQAGSG